MEAIPIIDIAPLFGAEDAAKARVAREIAGACEGIGFFTVAGHGVPRALLTRLSTQTHAFFDQPMEAKRAIAAQGGMGYIRVGGEQLAASLDDTATTDFKESLNLAQPENDASWPADRAYRSAINDYFAHMHALARTLMRGFALALNLQEGWFSNKIDHAGSVLRLLNYPPVPVIKPGMTWAGEHTDYGILTILWSPNSGGLQAKNRAGRWLDVDAAPETFVINIGDLMMNWTNDRWVSTLHRVVPTSGDATRRRQSIPFFYNPNPDALIECLPTCTDAQHPPKYAPILARDHLHMKINKAVKM